MLTVSRCIFGQGLGIEDACDRKFVSGTWQVERLLLKVSMEVSMS